MATSEPVRRVRIPALLISVNHISVGERLLNGQPRATAFADAYEMYYGLIVPAAQLAWWPGESLHAVSQLLHPELGAVFGDAVITGRLRDWSVYCFAQAAYDACPYLLAGEPEDGPVPSIVLPAADADRLGWLLEAMRRYATGGGGLDLCVCARGAIDKAAGRPRQKRAPVDAGWLAGEISDALDDVWARLRADARKAGGPHCEMLWQMPRQGAKTLQALLRDGGVWQMVKAG